MLKVHVIEITKACVAAFMKAIKTEDSENVFFKAIANNFFLTWICCRGRPSTKWNS